MISDAVSSREVSVDTLGTLPSFAHILFLCELSPFSMCFASKFLNLKPLLKTVLGLMDPLCSCLESRSA